MSDWSARALALGADAALMIRPGQVVVADWVRLKCQYGCGCYGAYRTCPPHSPPPDVTRGVLRHYHTAVLLRLDAAGGTPADEEPYRRRLDGAVVGLEREAFLAGHHRAWGLGAGPCPHCPECNLEQPCRFPELARPSMEACGIDVYSTVRRAGWQIQVVRQVGDPFCLFGLVLID